MSKSIEQGGKVGVGIFASLNTFLSNHEDKDLYLGYTAKNKDTGEMGPHRSPIKIKGESDGTILNLSQISSIGEYNHNGKKRTKLDFVSMVFTECVDNAKNKLLPLPVGRQCTIVSLINNVAAKNYACYWEL